MSEFLGGQLLIAGPSLWDTNFRRSVVLIGEHNDEGALGVILNRPAGTTIGESVPVLTALVGEDEPLFLGGPVQTDSVVIIADFEDVSRAGLIAFGSIGFLVGEVGADDGVGLRRARVFAGYAGWGAGQLEAEVTDQAWIPERATPEDVFFADPERLWESVVDRKGEAFKFLRTMPFDPSLN